MALIRTSGAVKSGLIWVYSKAGSSEKSGFYDLDGNLVETTGSTFTDKHGITMTYTSNDAVNVTNNSGKDIKVLNYATSGTSSVTPLVIANGATENGLWSPTILMV